MYNNKITIQAMRESPFGNNLQSSKQQAKMMMVYIRIWQPKGEKARQLAKRKHLAFIVIWTLLGR
jgi:hypothetical protein